MRSSNHIVIIGCGYAGAAAAVHLASRGVRVTLCEATDRPGGRASSFVEPGSGVVLDNGQHLMIGAYRETLTLLRTLGTDTLLATQPAFSVPFVSAGGRRARLGALAWLPGRIGMIAGLLTSSHLSLADRVSLVRAILAIRATRCAEIESATIDEWLRALNQSERVRHEFWTPFVLAVMNNTPERAAAVLLHEVIDRLFFGESDAARLIMATVGLSDLLAPIASWLASRGGELRLHTAIDEMCFDGSIVTAVRSTSNEVIPCDAVISAVPPHRLASLVPAHMSTKPVFKDLSTFEYSPIITCYLRVDRPVMDELFLGSTGTTPQWIFNRSRILRQKGAEQELALVMSAVPTLVDASPDAIIEQCIADLRSLLPTARDANFTFCKVIKEKRATFVATPSRERLRPGPVTVSGNLFLAGDWTYTRLPATIEGAAVSGVLAAQTAIENLQRHG